MLWCWLLGIPRYAVIIHIQWSLSILGSSKSFSKKNYFTVKGLMCGADVVSWLFLWLNVAEITLSVGSGDVVPSAMTSSTCAVLQKAVLSYSDKLLHTPIMKVNQALERCPIVYPHHSPANWPLHPETPVLALLQRPAASRWRTQNLQKWDWNDWNGYGDIWRNISNSLSHTRFLHIICAPVKLRNGKVLNVECFFFLKTTSFLVLW